MNAHGFLRTIVGNGWSDNHERMLQQVRLENVHRRLKLQSGNDPERARILAINGLVGQLKRIKKLSSQITEYLRGYQ